MSGERFIDHDPTTRPSPYEARIRAQAPVGQLAFTALEKVGPEEWIVTAHRGPTYPLDSADASSYNSTTPALEGEPT